MSAEVLVAIIGGFVAIVTTIISGMFSLKKRVETLISEFKPNGGSSMKDHINRLEQRIDAIYKILAEKDK
jgi:hypothetical protein